MSFNSNSIDFVFVFIWFIYRYNVLGKSRRIRVNSSGAQALRLSNSLREDSYFPLELERRAMSFERLTDAGPKGGKAAFKESPSETVVKPQGGFLETPQPLGVAFVRSTNPKANCRLERTTMRRPRCRLHRLLEACFLFYCFCCSLFLSFFCFPLNKTSEPNIS